jgi:hypothetical protein
MTDLFPLIEFGLYVAAFACFVAAIVLARRERR